MRPFDVMVARLPGNNQEHPASANYVIELMEKLIHDERVGRIRSWYLADTPTDMVRNRAVKDALTGKFDYLLMIDSDMQPDVMLPQGKPFWDTAWDFMMDRRQVEEDRDAGKLTKYLDEELLDTPRDEPVAPATIAAPYCAAPPNEQVVVMRWADKETTSPDDNFSLEYVPREYAARKTGIEEVAALPTGLILYDLRVFRKLEAPWFSYEWTDGYHTHKASTEDVVQTRNASLLGMPQFCAWDCWAGHLKTKLVIKPHPLTIQDMRRKFADGIVRYRSLQEKP